MQLLELVAALAVQSLVIATMLQQAAVFARDGASIERGLSAQQRDAHLRRLLHGARNGAWVSAVASESVVFHADRNGDGRIDTRSSESTALSIARSRGRARLTHRIGRQTMTLLEGPGSAFSLGLRDAQGRPTLRADTAALMEVSWPGAEASQFAVNARPP